MTLEYLKINSVKQAKWIKIKNKINPEHFIYQALALK